MIRRGCATLVLGLALVCGRSWVTAAEHRPQKPLADSSLDSTLVAERFVKTALQAELEGDDEGRAIYLQEALSDNEQNANAQWQSGNVKVGDQWMSIDEAASQAIENKYRSRYLARRAAAGRDALAQFELARWCRQRGLLEEARGHLRFALQTNPRLANRDFTLGLVQQNGDWITLEEQNRQVADARAARKSLSKWQPKIRQLRRLVRQSDLRSESARAELLAIHDPEATPAVVAVFNSQDEQDALLAVAILDHLPGQRSADTLAQLGAFNASVKVRLAATDALKTRSIFSYAPVLLAALVSPLEAQFEEIRQAGANVVRLKVLQEGPLADYVVNQTLQVEPLAAAALDGQFPDLVEAFRNPTRERAIINLRAQTAEAQIRNFNQRASQTNERITAVLATAAGADGDRPRDYWEWWYNHNDIYYPPERPTYEVSLSQVERYGAVCECFQAGTPIWTSTGMRPIETIEIGDHVFAQEIESGEIALKPVLATSIRPTSPLLKLQIGEHEFVVTQGHPFWVIGQGWRMAKELSVGDRVHTASGAAEIDRVEAGPQAEAYNFVVNEFNTYFVGQPKLLVHDNSLRRHTDNVLPGLAINQ